MIPRHTLIFFVLLGSLSGISTKKRAVRNITLSDEKKINKYLKRNYVKIGVSGRPVMSNNDSTPMHLGLGLIQMDLNEKEKLLMTSVWVRMRWRDQYLVWDPEEFGGIDVVRMSADDIWIPDVMLINTADPKHEIRNNLLLVSSDGWVSWVPHQIFRSSCSINVSNFPFDEQNCHMWFGSWTHKTKEIGLQLAPEGGMDLSTFQSDYKETCEWDIKEVVTKRVESPPDDPDGYTVLTFSLYLRRKITFTSYILTLPCIFLALLSLVVFCLPPERPDRTGLAMSLFSSFLVLLLILVEAAPPTASSVPKLGLYYCFNMVVIMGSIFLSSLVVNINKRGDMKKHPPRILKLLILECLARILVMHKTPCICCKKGDPSDEGQSCDCCGGCSRKGQAEKLSASNLSDGETAKMLSQSSNESTNNLTPTVSRLYDRDHPPCVDKGGLANGEKLQSLERYFFHIDSNVRELQNDMRRIVNTIDGREKAAREARIVIGEWKEIARVMDRFFFLFYLSTIVFSLLTLFPRPT